MHYFSHGSTDTLVDDAATGRWIDELLSRLGPLRRVLLVPPDFTRYHSGAGALCSQLYQRLQSTADVAVLPAIGTHRAMTAGEINEMFPGIPHDRFRIHDWRQGVTRLGEVPAAFIEDVSEGKLHYSIHAEVDRLIVDEKWDRIISVGQLVPHEVIGIANHNKNIFVGTGGVDTINKTHFLGAVYGMERIMGQAKSPVRDVLNYASTHFAQHLPITYLLTVRVKDSSGRIVARGLYAGDDEQCFLEGARLCQQVNFDRLAKPLKKVVVYLDPHEFKSTWLGNKSVYRTRMAIADGGELIVLAPGVEEFGEDKTIDQLIRRYGYLGTPTTLENVDRHADLAGNLSAAAHLIHGSSEGRFTITYCPGKLTQTEIEGVGYQYADLAQMQQKYDINRLVDGYNTVAGEEIFYISNPALGLWSAK